MMRCDALVVGGGPAGSTCAWKLRQAGLDVLVIDQATFPRDKTCAGWITPRVVETLALAVDEYRRGRVFQPVSAFRTSRMSGPPVETRFADAVSFGICRCEFDDYLLRRSGARVLDGTAVTRIERRGMLWVVNDEIEAPLLVGAGGHFCPVAQHLGAVLADETIVAAQEVEIALTPEDAASCDVEPGVPELFFCDDLKGYGWIFLKEDVLTIGLGREDRRGLHAHVESFAAARAAGSLARLRPRLRWKGHAYLLRDHSMRRIVDDGVLLVGDAAGLAHACSGEGIGPAVDSARLAAQTILEADGRYEEARLAPYRERLKAWRPAGSIGHLLPERLAVPLGSWLLDRAWFARRVVIERWFLGANAAAS